MSPKDKRYHNGKLAKTNDENSLCWRESIGEMALHIKGKVSTTYAVLALAYAGRACACPPWLSLPSSGIPKPGEGGDKISRVNW